MLWFQALIIEFFITIFLEVETFSYETVCFIRKIITDKHDFHIK